MIGVIVVISLLQVLGGTFAPIPAVP
jgi:hypothetical protein